jgi:diacylglycerol kinase
MSSKHSIAKSFSFAFEGMMKAFEDGRNFKIQLFFGIVTIVLGFIFKISKTDWLFVILTIAFVLILELINTSLESIVDIVSPGIHDKAKIAKDVAAAAVLISSIVSIIIGAIIFLPKILVGVQ